MLLVLNVIEMHTHIFFIIQYTVKYILMNSIQHTRFEIKVHKITDISYWMGGVVVGSVGG